MFLMCVAFRVIQEHPVRRPIEWVSPASKPSITKYNVSDSLVKSSGVWSFGHVISRVTSRASLSGNPVDKAGFDRLVNTHIMKQEESSPLFDGYHVGDTSHM